MSRKRILVPVNFGTQSDAALKYASKIAEKINGTITCLHVVEEPGIVTDKFLSKDIKEKIRREAGQRLSAIVNANIRDQKIPFEIIVSAGKVHRKISEKANDVNAEFIIMGRSDSQDNADNHTGSNTKQVIIQAHMPVITVISRKQINTGYMLVPLDLSKPVYSKILKAIEVARLLHTDVNVLALAGSGWKTSEAHLRNRLDEIKKVFTDNGVICLANLLKSKNPVHHEIISFANATRAALILNMIQQESQYPDLFTDSAAHKIINQSELPVISIAMEKQEDTGQNDALLTKPLDPISLC